MELDVLAEELSRQLEELRAMREELAVTQAARHPLLPP